MKRYLFIPIVVLLSISAYAQTIKVDKTTADYRMIFTEPADYYGAGRDDMLSLNYLYSDSEDHFLIVIDFDESSKDISAGYKMLLKHADGDITELTCYSSDKKHNVVGFFVPSVEYYEHTSYWLTRDQVEKIISSPVIKMRVEYNLGYFDIDTTTKAGDSKFSTYIASAYSNINNALENDHTGLYDNF